MKRVDIKTGFNCNNHCRFCVQGNKRTLYGSKTTEEIKKILQETRKDCDSVVFTGGEPTIREDIIDLVSYAKKLKFETIQIQTNGRMFCYKEFCNEIISAGANEFSPAIHGHTAELHDYLTCSEGSFQQTLSGIKNLKEHSQRIITNTVITKSNYRHLPQIAQLLVDLGVDQFQFAFVHALGSAKENFTSVVPRMTLVEPYVKKGLDIGIKAGISVMTEATPYCLMQGYEHYIAEKIIPPTKIYDFDEVIDNFTEARQKQGKLKGPSCQTCRYYQTCEGPWKEYPEKFGWEEFKPVRHKYNYVSIQDIVLKTIKDIFDLLIEKNDLTSHKKIIHQIRKILFFAFNPSRLLENQKFDFSFSAGFKNQGGLRFSYNNFGEKEKFEQKIIKAFLLFKRIYYVKKLKELLDYMKADNNKHQTTVGIEWLKGDSYPRLKVYFEELFNCYSQQEILLKLRRVCKILNFDFNRLGINSDDNVGAICVDFLPFQSINLKIYYLFKQPNKKYLDNMLELHHIHRDRGILSLFLKRLIAPQKSFYYITKRFSQEGNLLSLKLYRIYEIKQINHFAEPILEIENFLKEAKLNKLLKEFLEIKTICGQNTVNLFPVIIAVDRAIKNEDRVDIYLSFR